VANVIELFWCDYSPYRRNLSQNLTEYATRGVNYAKKFYNIGHWAWVSVHQLGDDLAWARLKK
jgi:hypothetical protein